MKEPSQKNEDAFATPNALLSTIRCVFICATIVLIAYLFVPRNNPAPRLWTPDLVETNGEVTTLGESRQLEFWTPSAETKGYLHEKDGQVVPTEMWEVISNDAPVVQFGNLLHSNPNVLGYRRIEVWGQGRSTFKPGWWWTLNVFTNYSASDLAHSYEGFWKSHQVLFVEVIDNRGSNEK